MNSLLANLISALFLLTQNSTKIFPIVNFHDQASIVVTIKINKHSLSISNKVIRTIGNKIRFHGAGSAMVNISEMAMDSSTVMVAEIIIGLVKMILRGNVFGSGGSREPYKSLGPFFCSPLLLSSALLVCNQF